MKYRNYLILAVVYVFSIGFVLYCSSVYKTSMYNISSSGINDVTSSNYDELYNNVYNYSLEHSSFSIFVSDRFDIESDDVLFINTSKVKLDALNKLISSFEYDQQIKDSDFPFYIVFKNGKIKEIIHD